MFDDPVVAPQGDKVNVKELLNKLVIVRPLEFEPKMITVHKPDGGEAVFANIAVIEPIDGEPYKVYRRALFMQGYLVGAFKGSLNRNLLGTIYEGVPKKGNAPFLFQSLAGNEKAVSMAKAWMALHESELLATPEPAFGEPAPDSAGQQPSTLESMRAARNPWLNDEPPF